MNRILLVLLLFSTALAGCSKSTDVVAQVQSQQVKDIKIIDTYLANNNIKATEVDSLGVPTGIYYAIDTLGTGSNIYTTSTTVTVGYTGTLLTTGAIFAQTNNFHPSFVLGTVIRGWLLGLEAANCQQGGTVTLYIPSHYAYGPYAQPGIGLPANAVLIFTIKLYSITN